MFLSITAESTHRKPRDDRQALWRFKSGKINEFDQLVRRYQDELFTLAYYLVGDFRLANEMTYQVFLELFQDREKMSVRVPFRKQLMTQLVSQYNQINRASASSVQDGEGESEARLRQALLQVVPDQRIVLILHEILKKTPEEISSDLGVSVGTVKTRLHSGRMKLKGLI